MIRFVLRDTLLRLFFRRRWRGFETLFRSTGRRPILGRNRYGARFLLDPHDYVDSIVLRDGFYESEVFEACCGALRLGDVFWDVGSCFGLHAVTVAVTRPGIGVHAFEPNSAEHRAIRENAALNRVTIELWPLALCDFDGTAELELPPPGNSGMASLHRTSSATVFPSACVITARADTLIASGRAPLPAVVKIDVEGSEAAVLRGMGCYLSDPRLRLIVLECGPGSLVPDAGDPVRALLLGAGFQLRALTRNEATAHALINVVAARPS